MIFKLTHLNTVVKSFILMYNLSMFDKVQHLSFFIYFRDFWLSVTSTDLETNFFWNDQIEIWPIFRICDLLWPLMASWLLSLGSLRQECHFDIKFTHIQSTSKFDPKWAGICNLTSNPNFSPRNYFQIPLIILSYCSLKLVKPLIFKN